MDDKSLYKDSNTNTLGILLLLSLGIIGTCLYLTDYYFNAKFPTGLAGASVCNINSFFNCDSTTHSPFSNIAGVPVSLLGLLVGVLSLAGFIFRSARYEATLYALFGVNLAGCLVLFLYSLVALGTLCPFCTLYYVLSALAFFFFHRRLPRKEPDVKHSLWMGLAFLALFGSAYAYVGSKESGNDKLRAGLAAQFRALPVLGSPEEPSPYKVSFPLDEGLAEAPLRIVKFSDFECPSCKMMSGHLAQIAMRYRGKVDIQYYFYPLDPSCNPGMRSPLHRNACNASYLAYCLPEKFREIEHMIFENQEGLSSEWLRGIAEREGVLDCYEAPETKEAVTAMIRQAEPFNVSSTPTILVNGRKIEGVLPLGQLMMVLDEAISPSR